MTSRCDVDMEGREYAVAARISESESKLFWEEEGVVCRRMFRLRLMWRWESCRVPVRANWRCV